MYSVQRVPKYTHQLSLNDDQQGWASLAISRFIFTSEGSDVKIKMVTDAS